MTLTEKLLDWYEKNGRDLPWRVKGGAHPDPYRVWVSEIMLQQTTVKTVRPYFERFMARFPDISALAAAPVDDVLLLWQGLGYYTRARKLHECAKTVAEQYGGRFPADRELLLKLPGIGPYTSASIAALGYNKPEAVVDGNVIRVLCRLKGWKDPVSSLTGEIDALARGLTSRDRPADYASAIMDLGATVCTPRSPLCRLSCPWSEECVACRRNLTDDIPNTAKPPKAVRKGYVFWIEDGKGGVLIRRRTEKGLLSGLAEFPWNTDESLPFESGWEITGKKVTHVFSHFTLTLTLARTQTDGLPPVEGGFFVRPEDFGNYPFSTLMKKVMKKAL